MEVFDDDHKESRPINFYWVVAGIFLQWDNAQAILLSQEILAWNTCRFHVCL